MISFSLKTWHSTTVARRLFVAGAGLGPLFVAVHRADDWLESWNPGLIAVAISAVAAFVMLAIGIAVRGSAGTVKRAAMEIAAFVCAVAAAEVILVVRAPETWPSDPFVQRWIERERAAERRGIEYDARLRADVIRELRSQGVDAVPGFAQILGSSRTASTAIRERGLLPLSNASNALIVECDEGRGFLKYRSDELGFNNPPGIAVGPVDVAVIGESLAVGHCVPPSTSAVDLIRARFPRTANFGIAGSRVLSQIGVFREYVEPLEPPVVVWFVNAGFAQPQDELDQPILVKYLDDPEFSQGLRNRQDEIDSFIREVAVPLNLARDDALRSAIARANELPLERMIKLRDVRGLVEVPPAMRRREPAPDFAHFERAVDLVVDSARGWGGTVIVAVLPSYALSHEVPGEVARYEAVLCALAERPVTVVDGAALFAAQPDFDRLYTLGIENHPNERGHALLAEAIIASVERAPLHEKP